jgi:leucine dehydrogenase
MTGSANGAGSSANGGGSQEELLARRGERSGLQLVIAVDSTALGPALGGCRMWSYDRVGDGIDDAQRLAQAMTLKAAAAGLDLGGGKGVICLPGKTLAPGLRRAVLLDFADAVESLDGRYITAEDVGTGAEDMAVIAERTSHVVGLPAALGGRGDPSPLTARGVEQAIRACCRQRFGSAELAGLRVCVIGLGHVGTVLARRLVSAGAQLVVSDLERSRCRRSERLGAQWVDPDEALVADCDVLAPCALGEAVDASNVDALRCQILCGAANNVLADQSIAERLERRGIVYAPDFIANAGGLINVYAELHGFDAARVDQLVDSIGDTMLRVLRDAEDAHATPLEAARRLAQSRLAAGAAVQAA